VGTDVVGTINGKAAAGRSTVALPPDEGDTYRSGHRSCIGGGEWRRQTTYVQGIGGMLSNVVTVSAVC
jgi:hypothetical protein